MPATGVNAAQKSRRDRPAKPSPESRQPRKLCLMFTGGPAQIGQRGVAFGEALKMRQRALGRG